TDGNGMFGFTDLDPTLTYVVQFVNDPAMNMPFTTPNVGDDATDSDAGPDGITGPITLTSGQNDPTIDAGLVNLPASLGDKVFKDLNGNGQQDADEPGIPGITVNLWTDDDGDGSPDTQIATTTTDGNGMYGFADLDPTLVYVVQFVNDPAMNMPFTTPNVGDDATDSDAGPDGITGPITLTSGQNDPTIDAGLVNQPASLGDKVFKDLNGNGQQDADEPGIPGITVNLWTDDDGDGTPDTQIATTTTDANGMYSFGDLDPTLTYVIQFVNDPAMNMPFTTPNVGDDATDSDAGPDGITGPITLTSGQNDLTIDAGLVNQLASIGDKVFKDLNSDGQQDAGEPGVPGITVNLWTDDDGDGTPDTQIATTTTDANGMYSFADLDPTLTYVIQFINDPAMNMPFTTPNVGDDATDSDAGAGGITGPINLTSGENNLTIDAGIVNLPASLGDKVFKDLNSDGQQDADEPGVPGITVNLWTDDDGDGTPDTQISTTTTDANGMYGFANLDPALTYVVQFVNDPAMNMPFTTPNVGNDATDSDAGAGGITGPINLASGENNPTIDAGIVNLVAKLGDFVWIDTNRDGVQDAGEPGVENATVNLWIDNDGDGTPDVQVATTTTDVNGMYMFNDLTPGVAYVVQFVGIPGKVFTTQGAGTFENDSNADANTGLTAPVVLSSGEFNPTIDAGFIMLVASVDVEKATNGEDADTPTGPVITVGDDVTWTYVVTNTGELTLNGLVVSDDQGVAVNCPADTLAPGDSFTCTGNGTATEGQYANVGTVVGNPTDGDIPVGDPVTDNDPSHYLGELAQCVPGFVKDHFDHVSYENNDGDMDWTGPWMEHDPEGGGAHSGNVMIENGQLTLNDSPNSGTEPSIRREVDLSDYSAAMLAYDWSTSNEVGGEDTIVLEISSDGGNTYTVLRTYTDLHGANSGSEMIDISSFISANTVIRFRITDYYGGNWDKFMIDFVRIDKKCDAECVPGFVKDHFNHVSYDNNDGDMDWLTPWMEHDPRGGGAHSGNVMVADGKLVLHDYPNSGTQPSARRSVDLSNYPSAMLSYEWSTSDEVDTNDKAVLEISTDGGNTYTILRTYTGLEGWNGGNEMIDISAYISANTTIRFRIAEYYGANWDKFMIDTVRIDKKCDAECVPGFVKDHFSHVSYDNNDGDMDWDSHWIEDDPQGGGAHSGNVRINGGQLIMNDYPNSGRHPEIRRTVDLSGYNSAMLSFDWSISEEANENDHVALWISPDGGQTWHSLDTFNGVSHQTTTGSEMYDISAFISDQTVISFQISNNFGGNWDKFMVDFVRVDKKCEDGGPGPQACTTPVTSTPYHGLYLPNFVTHGEIDLYNFEDGAQFDRNADGTATLTGTVYKQGQPDYRYSVNLVMSGGTFDAPPGSPKNHFGYNTDDWYFYPNWNGTLTGLSWNDNASVTITRTGPAFQIGTGANDHQNEGDQYGGSGWFDWSVNSQPNDCDYYNDCINHSGSGDVNVRIEACPL
ncbi:MAG: SdrD B-like domain-containing protein, partial [Gammaproteobacteria bacterium]